MFFYWLWGDRKDNLVAVRFSGRSKGPHLFNFAALLDHSTSFLSMCSQLYHESWNEATRHLQNSQKWEERDSEPGLWRKHMCFPKWWFRERHFAPQLVWNLAQPQGCGFRQDGSEGVAGLWSDAWKQPAPCPDRHPSLPSLWLQQSHTLSSRNLGQLGAAGCRLQAAFWCSCLGILLNEVYIQPIERTAATASWVKGRIWFLRFLNWPTCFLPTSWGLPFLRSGALFREIYCFPHLLQGHTLRCLRNLLFHLCRMFYIYKDWSTSVFDFSRVLGDLT